MTESESVLAMPSLAPSARQKSYVDDSVTSASWQRGGVSARGTKDAPYELSDDFRQKQIDALERKYGGKIFGLCLAKIVGGRVGGYLGRGGGRDGAEKGKWLLSTGGRGRGKGRGGLGVGNEK